MVVMGGTGPHGCPKTRLPKRHKSFGETERLQALWPEQREARCTGGDAERGKALRHLELQKPPNLLEAWWAQHGGLRRPKVREKVASSRQTP